MSPGIDHNLRGYRAIMCVCDGPATDRRGSAAERRALNAGQGGTTGNRFVCCSTRSRTCGAYPLVRAR